MNIPTIGAKVTFTQALPYGIRRQLGAATHGEVTAVNRIGRIAVQPAGSTGVVWVEAIDIETEVTR